MALASEQLPVGRVELALGLALVTDATGERTPVRLTPKGTGPVPVLDPGQRLELVDAVVKTAADGSPVLVLAQGLIDKLRALEAATVARSCAVCGCTDDVACPGGCWWVTAEVCSMCSPIALVPL